MEVCLSKQQEQTQNLKAADILSSYKIRGGGTGNAFWVNGIVYTEWSMT